MRCNRCPMLSEWNTENGYGARCGIFGDDWGNPLQYEDKYGEIQGCYLDTAYIKKAEKDTELRRSTIYG